MSISPYHAQTMKLRPDFLYTEEVRHALIHDLPVVALGIEFHLFQRTPDFSQVDDL
jgi:hypothetical protein